MRNVFFLKFLLLCFLSTKVLCNSSTELMDDIKDKLKIPYEAYRLDNGLTVILSPDNKTPFIATSIWYGVGAKHEERNKTGLAHLFEHLMFEGSEHVAQDQHFKLLEEVGAYGVNASTSIDRTNYFQVVPKEQLELILSLESSRMFFLEVDQAKLDEQRAVVRREREQRYETSPYGEASLFVWKKLFPSPHPYNGLVIGSHKDLKNASLFDVKQFYNSKYGPTNATLTLVGDFDETRAKSLIDKYFKSLPKSKKVIKPKSLERTLEKEIKITIDEKIGKLPLVRIQYITPAVFKKYDAELDIVSHILTGGESSRLNTALKRKKALVNSISSFQSSMKDLSVFTINAVLNSGIDPEVALKEIDAQLRELTLHGPKDEELKRAKNAILTNQLFSVQRIQEKAEILQSYHHYIGTPDYLAQDFERYFKANNESIIKSLKKYLPTKTNRVVLFALPKTTIISKTDN